MITSPVYLPNQGNSCFVNSALQLLGSLNIFSHQPAKKSLLKHLIDIFDPSKQKFRPQLLKHFQERVSAKTDEFQLGEEGDCFKFLQASVKLLIEQSQSPLKEQLVRVIYGQSDNLFIKISPGQTIAQVFQTLSTSADYVFLFFPSFLPVQLPQQLCSNGRKFRLAGLVENWGTTASSGHYTSTVRREGKWVQISDEKGRWMQSGPLKSSNLQIVLFSAQPDL